MIYDLSRLFRLMIWFCLLLWKPCRLSDGIESNIALSDQWT